MLSLHSIFYDMHFDTYLLMAVATPIRTNGKLLGKWYFRLFQFQTDPYSKQHFKIKRTKTWWMDGSVTVFLYTQKQASREKRTALHAGLNFWKTKFFVFSKLVFLALFWFNKNINSIRPIEYLRLSNKRKIF